MSAYPFIEAEKVEGGNVAKACALMEVSRSAYYEWSKQRPSRRQLADAELLIKIAEVFDASTGHLRLAQGARRPAPSGHLREPQTGGPAHGAGRPRRTLPAQEDPHHVL